MFKCREIKSTALLIVIAGYRSGFLRIIPALKLMTGIKYHIKTEEILKSVNSSFSPELSNKRIHFVQSCVMITNNLMMAWFIEWLKILWSHCNLRCQFSHLPVTASSISISCSHTVYALMINTSSNNIKALLARVMGTAGDWWANSSWFTNNMQAGKTGPSGKTYFAERVEKRGIPKCNAW